MDIKTVVASAAASLAVVAVSVPVMVSYVTLQPTSPGVADTGNINVSGTAIAGKVRVGTTVAGGALIRVLDAGASGGIYSQSQGNGVYSESAGASGALSGGQFIARSTGGRGVIGSATATSGNTRGGLFDSKSPTGVGVYGVSSATSGTGVGVFGSATPLLALRLSESTQTPTSVWRLQGRTARSTLTTGTSTGTTALGFGPPSPSPMDTLCPTEVSPVEAETSP